jgi:hypothetical protein
MDFKNIFLDDYFLKWCDGPLNNYEKFSISCQIPIEMRDIGIDFNSEVNSVILNEMRITIVRNIIKQMISNNNFLLIDLMNKKNMSDRNTIFSSVLSGVKYKNLVTNSRISTEIGDSSLFHFDSFDKAKHHTAITYKTGKFLNLNSYCDPYLKYSEEVIVLFDDILFNITDYNLYEDESFGNIPRRNRVDFTLSWSNPNYRLVYYIDDEFNKSLPIVKSIIRDKKIDELLDDN